MPPQLVKLTDGPAAWKNVKDAADILWRTSKPQDLSAVICELRAHYNNPELTVVDPHTGVNAYRKGTVVCKRDVVTIAFDGSDSYETWMNFWTQGKSPGWWELPYPVFIDGNRVQTGIASTASASVCCTRGCS